MTAKGANGNCCCGGCSELPSDSVDPDAIISDFGRRLQPMRQFCCACLPRQVCATYQCGETQYRAVINLTRFCTGYDADQRSEYQGEIPIDGGMVDFRFRFEVVDDSCYVVFSSVALGVDGTDPTHQLLLTDANRRFLCYSQTYCKECQACGYTDGDTFGDCECLVWTVDADTCANNPATVMLCQAQTTSLTRDSRIPCDGCPELPQDVRPCGPFCNGCTCICSAACITVVIDDNTHSNSSRHTERVTYDPEARTYTTYDGFVIKIQANAATGNCELALTETGGYTPMIYPDPVPIDEDNDCPSPFGRWVFVDTTDPLIGISIIFSCATCRECEQVAVPTCCPDGDGTLPKVLIASFVTGVDCCDTHEIALVYNSILNYWTGTSQAIWAADGPYCDRYVTLTLSCGGTYWTLTMATDSPCVFSGTATGSGSCSPVNLSFGFTATGPSCCHQTQSVMPPEPPLEAAIGVVITE